LLSTLRARTDLAKNNWGGTVLISIIQRRAIAFECSYLSLFCECDCCSCKNSLQVRNALGRRCAPVLIAAAAPLQGAAAAENNHVMALSACISSSP
jgi:hypothetical protein